MSDLDAFSLDDAQAKKVCEDLLAAGGALSGGMVGGAFSAGTAGTAAAAVGTGGLVLLVLGGALIGLAAGRYFCGSITDKVRQQTSSMTKDDFKKFGIVMARYGTFTDGQLQVLARVGYQYASQNTARTFLVLPESTDRLRKELTSVLEMYAANTPGAAVRNS